MLLPIVKTWCAESGWRVLGQEALQVFGGSGYLRDYPLEQYVRDTKIDAIYEGTTGIQSLDLFERRLVRDRGATAGVLLDEIAQTVDDLATGALATESVLLGDALAAFRGILEHTFAQADAAPRVAALGPHPVAHVDGRPHRRLAVPAHRRRGTGSPERSEPAQDRRC
jgi:hypothetical protein